VGERLKFQLIQAIGWATIFTFMTGIVIFILERLGLAIMYALFPLPFLYPAETLFLLFAATWAIWFLFFLALGFVRRA
jgi:hypothetical protein